MTEATYAGAFDYVVIGGGTAGLVVATRLAELEDISVCVLEAGEDVTSTPEASIPGQSPRHSPRGGVVGTRTYGNIGLASKLWEKETNWKFSTVAQKYSEGKVIEAHRYVGKELCMNASR